MSDDGYTYTTISAGPGEPTRIGVSFYLDKESWIVVSGIKVGQPRLAVSHGDVSVCFGPRRDAVTAQDARIARCLADHAATYAAEMERLAAGNEASADGTAAA
jgi:hypothetical protein